MKRVAQPGVDGGGQRAEVLFGLGDRGFGGRAAAVRRSARPVRQLRSRSAAGRRRRPGSAPCQRSRTRRARRRAARRAPARATRVRARRFDGGSRLTWKADALASSLTVLQALGERVGQARGADRSGGAGDVVVGAVELDAHRVEVEQQPGRARISVARLPDAAGVQQPLAGGERRARSRRAAARRSRARPRGARRRAPRASGRSGRCGGRCASRHSSASSAESTYSQTGSRGLAW